ncbi:methyltransferase domain-containing protein [Sphingobium rhizovicinum]|uniref:Methyltransferase domain-containing protein n=1 Tax=Sphingobium rhizovicinum TaxID=432308 RepID=A0ABV7NCK1_9SPHN
MSELSHIFDQMRASPMNDWVGGSDPELVGDASIGILTRLLPLHNQSRILDFGCGIGRGLVSLWKAGVRPEQLIGMDIMPPVIDFCDQQIAPYLPGTKFELITGANHHYDAFIDRQAGKSQSALSEQYRDNFTDAYAFSVFTHVTQADFQSLLHFVSSMLRPGGRFMFTCFELNDFSRHMVLSGQALFPLDPERMRRAGDVLTGNDADPLAFIAFDRALIQKMVWNAGMAITKVDYGCWMGGGLGGGLQDAIVCTKLPLLQAVDQIQHTALVARDAPATEPAAPIDLPQDSEAPSRFRKMMQHWRPRK